MGKRIAALGLLLALLAGCAEPAARETPAADRTAAGAVQAVLDSQTDLEAPELLPPEDVELYVTELYGLDRETVAEAAIWAASGMDAREVAVLRMAEEEDGDTAAAALEAYRLNRRSSFVGYAPEQADLLEQALLVRNGTWIALLICGAPGEARTALEAYWGGAVEALAPTEPPADPTPGPSGPPGPGPTTGPTGTPDPTPAPSALPEPTPAPEPTVTPTPVPTPEPQEPSDTPAPPGEEYVPFDPPNEFDMTPYDTSAILAAWAGGDRSGLGEKDAAILEAAEQALTDCGITESMTDFRKELELHDWLVQTYYGRYDETVHDPRTPMGRADNTNPYGLLVRGYGICLGYATSFQLLMDLVGVECITVVGASADSTGDHAWNMVKLEGEWYCVDPTWEAAYYASHQGREERIRWSQHRYFNVTSDYMRETDHQWDYDSIPEATAARFRWDGTGPLPD